MCSIPKQFKTEVRDKIADRGTLWQNEGSVPHNGGWLHRDQVDPGFLGGRPEV